MTMQTPIRRTLGTMVVYGYPKLDLGVDLDIAARVGARVVEILPHWPTLPDPREAHRRIHDAGLTVWSAHGCWGGHSIRATRVDLADIDPIGRRASVDDLFRCTDWIAEAGGSHLVVHPGGLSDAEDAPRRAAALAASLVELAGRAEPAGIMLCVENMPPGVHPGSRMVDLAAIVAAIGRPGVRLALDTGHARIAEGLSSATTAADGLLATTHVHDNDGRADVHLPPGLGSIDWDGWPALLDRIGYDGPIILECIKHLRSNPAGLDDLLIGRLRRLCGSDRSRGSAGLDASVGPDRGTPVRPMNPP